MVNATRNLPPKANTLPLLEVMLLDKHKSRYRSFTALHPRRVSTASALRPELIDGARNRLWISYDRGLTEGLLKQVSWPTPLLGSAILIHSIQLETLPPLARCFRRIAFAPQAGFLTPAELAEVLQADNRADLFIGGTVDLTTQTITLWRGNLESLTVPFATFEKSGDGTAPNFEKFSVVDYGQTLRFGRYEAASDAILYEFDAEYRRKMLKQRQQSERGLGASLRRLRKQRGLRREDFAPEVAEKTIARIEQGKVQRVQEATRQAIARRLRVAPEELASF